MKTHTVTRLTLLAVIFTAGCEKPETREQLTSLQQKVASLEKDIKDQNDPNTAVLKVFGENIGKLNKDLDSLRNEVFRNEYELKPAIINPSGKGYGTLDSGKGMLLISCQDAQPYLDGYRLTLRIGNPLYMRFSGFTLRFKIGRMPPELPTANVKDSVADAFAKWRNDNDEWKKTLRQKEESFTTDLVPGHWNVVEATFPQTKAEDIAYIEVSIDTSQVILISQ